MTGLPMPPGGSPVYTLFFQGDGQTDIPFRDGRRCVTGTQVRLATKPALGGATSYPQGSDPSVSVQGGVVAPGARYYQAWYRNPAGPCGTGSSLSNGLSVIWVL